MDYNLWQQLILGATKPFRTGANILAQNWGSALTGKDMSQSENQGGFLKWLAGGITPEEQQVINDKPYLSALKSGAGMASTLAPFASQSLRTMQFAANPLKNRLAQLLSQGGLEGTMGGLGWSREGKEVQDMLTGGLIGAGGEVAMDYLVNPQFRQMLGDAMTTPDAMGRPTYRGSFGEDVDISGLRERAFKSANISDQPTQMTNMTNTRVLDSIQDDIERISNAPHTQEGLEYLQEVQRLYGDTLKNTIDMPLRVYDLPGNPDNYANLIDTTGDSNARTLLNTDAPEPSYLPDDELKIVDSLDYDNSMISEGKIDMSEGGLLDTVNPTGSIFTEYTPEKRATTKLAGNITTLDKTMGRNPDEMITIYRGAPNSQKEINPGDFITTNYQLAKDYAGNGHVLEKKVRLGDILDDILEPLGEEYLFRPSKDIQGLRNSAKELRGGFKEIIEKASKEGIK